MDKDVSSSPFTLHPSHFKLRPYPEYQDSGVPWLGKVPAHWKVLPHRALFREVNERDYPDEPLLSVTIARGVIPQEVLLANSSKKDSSNLDKSKYKLVQPGDIAYNKMRAWQGALGVSNYRGIVSPAYIVVRPRLEQVPEYYHFLLRTPGFIKEAERWSYGITSDMWSLRSEDFKRIYGLLPPLEEQRAIATFLTHIDRVTRRYIRAQRRLIALLKEQKQALIQQAVTGKLEVRSEKCEGGREKGEWGGEKVSHFTRRPSHLMKDSGIEWLGEIPEHWEEKPAKYFFREVDERSQTGKEELLSVSHITGVTPRSQKNVTMFKAESYVGSKLCKKDDLVINTMWAWMAALGVAKQEGIVSPSYAVYRPIKPNEFQPDYVDHLLRTPPYVSEYICRSTGIRKSRLRLYPEQFFKIPLIRPPYAEQEKIIEFVNKETHLLNQAIESAQRRIDLIREYRTRLIADVVTGKFDVRGVPLPIAASNDFDKMDTPEPPYDQ